MELILQGWIGRNSEGNLGLAEEIDDYYKPITESIMNYFNYAYINRGDRKSTRLNSSHD